MQYHAFPQNDKFWGSNFTEWTNLKLAFFNPWNFQPIRHPLSSYGGYYNLLDYQQRRRMGSLANFYGIEVLRTFLSFNHAVILTELLP